MKAEIRGDELIIRILIDKKPSKSGKTTIIATSGGNKPTDIEVDGQKLVIGLNAYIPKK